MAMTILDVRRLAEAWRSAGLDEAIAVDLDGFVAADRFLVEAWAQYKHGRKPEFERVTNLLAEGQITLTEAVASYTAAGDVDTAVTMFDATRRKIVSRVNRYFASMGTGVIADHLAPRSTAIHEAAEAHAIQIGEATNAEQAMAAGKAPAAAWANLCDLYDQHRELGQAAKQLGRGGLIPSDQWRHRHPDLVPSRRDAANRYLHDVRWFADLVLSGAGPRVLIEEPDPAWVGR